MGERQDGTLRDVLLRAAAALVAAALTGSVGWLPPGRGAAHPKVAAETAGPGRSGAEASDTVRHRIRYGETLSEIALRYGTGVRAIAEANGIPDPDRIVAGRVLVIPGKPAARPEAPPPAKPPSPAPSPAPGPGAAQAVQPASKPRVPDRASPGTGPADLVLDGPGGIRVQVYGTLVPSAIPAPALPGAAAPQAVTGPGLLLPGERPTAPPATRSDPAEATSRPGSAGGGTATVTGAGAGEEPLISLRFPPGEKVVALTFNGLPDAASLPALVRALDDAGGHATFFPTGAAARGRGDVILELLARGHEVGVQGLEPEDLTALPAEKVAASLDAARRVLLEAGAPPPRFFRPPLGRFDSRVIGAARRLGLETVLWSSIGLRDLNDPEPALLVEQARAAAFPGAILMLHADRPGTVSALPAVLAGLRQDGYRALSLSELLARASEVAGPVR